MFHQEHHKIHISPRHDGKWEVVITGEEHPHFVSHTKEEALDCARELAKERGLELIPHTKEDEAFFSGYEDDEGTQSNEVIPPKDEQH